MQVLIWISNKPFLIFDGRFLKAAQYWLSVILCYNWIHPEKFNLWYVVSRHKEIKTSLRMGIVSIHMMNCHYWLCFLTLCEKWVSLSSRNIFSEYFHYIAFRKTDNLLLLFVYVTQIFMAFLSLFGKTTVAIFNLDTDDELLS